VCPLGSWVEIEKAVCWCAASCGLVSGSQEAVQFAVCCGRVGGVELAVCCVLWALCCVLCAVGAWVEELRRLSAVCCVLWACGWLSGGP